MTPMQIVIETNGNARCVYSEKIDLTILGRVNIRRGSHVEPNDDGCGWTADLSPVGGPVLGPFSHRSEALAAELQWLERHWL